MARLQFVVSYWIIKSLNAEFDILFAAYNQISLFPVAASRFVKETVVDSSLPAGGVAKVE